ncbi:MAG: septum formation initiator family protein [Bifidobacterium sp.]|nr:septum formation initiator family protein [Bifidobacterium sp.]
MGKRTAERTKATAKGAKGAEGGKDRKHAGAVPLFLALFIVVLGLISLVTTFHTYALNLSELNALRKQESSLVSQKKELENDIDRWNDDAYVTAQARERLGYVFEGETPVRVEHPEAIMGKEPTSEEEAGKQESQESKLPWYSELAYSFGQADDPKQDHAASKDPTSAPTTQEDTESK